MSWARRPRLRVPLPTHPADPSSPRPPVSCSGIGRHIALRLVADGEAVLDVSAILSVRARVFATGHRSSDRPVEAHSVAVAALRGDDLRQVTIDDTTVALRLLVDRRELLGRTGTETVSRLHHLLELVPGGARKFLST